MAPPAQEAGSRPRMTDMSQCLLLLMSPFDAQQLDLEDQRRIRRDHIADPAGAVAEIGWDDERALATDLHRGNAFVPAGDHLPSANRKLEGLTAVERAVELLALGAVLVEPAGVMHDASLTGPRGGAGADLGVDGLQSGGRGHGLSDFLGGCGAGIDAGAAADQSCDEGECRHRT